MQRLDVLELRSLLRPCAVPYWSNLVALTHLGLTVAVLTDYTNETPEGGAAFVREIGPMRPGMTA